MSGSKYPEITWLSRATIRPAKLLIWFRRVCFLLRGKGKDRTGKEKKGLEWIGAVFNFQTDEEMQCKR